MDKSVQGVVVAKVDPNSDAASRGLRTGDVILQINQRAITSPQVAAEVINGVKKDGRSVVVILLQRDDDRLNVPVKLKADK
nr:PDZ domain-containing protein [Hankyongella ginsenosidimutans]